MRVTKKIEALAAKPTSKGTTRWSLMTTDNIWYSTFDTKLGAEIEKFKKGDICHIEYEMSADGVFANLTSVIKAEGEEAEKAEKEETKEKDIKQRSIRRQAAAKVASWILESLDLDGMSNAERMGVFKATWETIKEEFEKLD